MTSSVHTWIGEASGPLLLLPAHLLPEWSGIDVPEYRSVMATFRWNAEEVRACDYDRACDVEPPAGIIPVGHGEGLVLSEGVMPTAWLARGWGGILARWVAAESDAAADRALAQLSENSPSANGLAWEAVGTFSAAGGSLALFNAAEPGGEPAMARLTIVLRGGEYRVRWAQYQPDADTSFELIELRRAAI